ncbi:hypothetical protein GCM10011414_02130 [Croceivirga lutea]|uniref:FG-GAP-like repeat-containing protein n=1 Tax=Croceivirga lutea TaxID=1775167 RepID=UPI00163B076C|nr:FG-GAP-like repeat-containing protein [Croceivirga lutea]GGG36359.1 hypothetical protein GCM10011414_02130 [Croceivirga lutea]
MIRVLKAFFLLIVLVGCNEKKQSYVFSELPSTATGIQFSNTLKQHPELNILTYLYYYNGAGVTTADFNNDGLVDIYFTSNQGADKLYLNHGDFKFTDITTIANINNSSGWSTGVTQVDINADGLLDIYICKVANYKNLAGHNLLYVNQGINDDGIPIFKEQSKDFGLDFSGFSTQAGFLDYDLDGDLDMYLLNHSVHPNRTYGKGAKRKQVDAFAGDRLYQNNDSFFKDVSSTAGIFQGSIGYGLGISIADINNDRYPDIYVGNDFFENDYLYVNQKNGTFKEVISQKNPLGHTSHYSMGNALADLNNDGLQDIISLDMLPENLKTYKTSGLEYGFPIYQQYLKNGYNPQFMQNTLHLNNGNTFSEIAELSGIAATEWSWSPLLADFDNDGLKDIYITNGILGATNDMDYMNFIANADIQKRIEGGMKSSDMPLTKEIPAKKVTNYFFKSANGYSFKNVTKDWSPTSKSFSNGASYADLDNDGDLDLVVNNVNEKAFILKNNSNYNHGFLRVNLDGENSNKFGVGCKLVLYQKDKSQTLEHFPTRGYLSAVSNTLHFGLGKGKIDSLLVLWPSGKSQILKNIESNTLLRLKENEAQNTIPEFKAKSNSFLKSKMGIGFLHKENGSLDFDREPLAPFANSNWGPTIAVADIDQNGLEDIFLGGAKNQASKLFLQNTDGTFIPSQNELFEQSKLNEDTASLFVDVNNDGFLDLIVASGGNEFSNGTAIQPRLYVNNKGILKLNKTGFPTIESNISSINSFDFENDGDLDLIFTSNTIPGAFGKTPKQYLLRNNGDGKFTNSTIDLASKFAMVGNVTESVVFDIDENGYADIIVVGQWMPVTLFLNNGKELKKSNVDAFKNTNGLWNTIHATDFDNDGDLDIFCGNWGLNSKLSASAEKPLKLYRNDFDGNGKVEPLVTYFHGDIETPFASKDDLVKQLPFLNKSYLSYHEFASASVSELFGNDKLKKAEQKFVTELKSCYFENMGKGKFKKHPLPWLAQQAPIFDIISDDFNNDNNTDILITGNNFEINTQLGRLDALRGLFLQNDKNEGFKIEITQNLEILGAVRNSNTITIQNTKNYIIGQNNGPLLMFEKLNETNEN